MSVICLKADFASLEGCSLAEYPAQRYHLTGASCYSSLILLKQVFRPGPRQLADRCMEGGAMLKRRWPRYVYQYVRNTVLHAKMKT